MINFTADELREYLDARKGATFINLFAVSVPKMRKTDNPYFGKIVHLWARNVTFGASYQNSVNRRWAEVEADEYFVAEKLWRGKGERINRYMARHVDKLDEYLVYQLRTDSNGVAYAPLHDEYRDAFTGEVVDIEKLRPFMPKKRPSKAQQVKVLGCRETFPRTVHVDGGTLGKYRLGVYQLNADGEHFCMEGMELAAA